MSRAASSTSLAEVWKGKVFTATSACCVTASRDLTTLRKLGLVDESADTPLQKLNDRRQGPVAAVPRRSSTAGRACSTAGANPSSSTTPSPTNCRATAAYARPARRTATASRSATRSAWFIPLLPWSGLHGPRLRGEFRPLQRADDRGRSRSVPDDRQVDQDCWAAPSVIAAAAAGGG